MKMNKGIRAVAVMATAFLSGSLAQAADGTWTNLSGGSWDTTTNWLSGTVADGTDFTADFSTLNITVDRTIALNSSHTIGNLIFGDTTASNNWTLNNNGSGANILTLARSSGTPTITVNNQTTTISLELAGSNGMTKAGAGTLVLTGANSYTGTTTVSAGALTLGSGGSLTTSSTLSVGGSGTFNFSGAAAATQTVNGLNVTSGLGTVNNTVSGTTLTLGAITRSGNGMVDFGTATGNVNTSTSNTGGILGAWAYQGTGTALDYAVSNGAGVAISSLGSATVLPSAGPGSATTNYTLSGAQTQTANTVGNTLRYTGGANTLALGTTSLGLSGLMNAGTGLLTITGTAANPGLVTTGEFDVVSNTQGITISSVISGTGSLVFGGVGTTVAVAATPGTGVLILSGANTYNGGTVINSGSVRASNSSALGTGAVTVVSGAQLQLGGVSLSNSINLNGASAVFVNSGTNVLSGTVTLQSNSTISNSSGGNNTLDLSGAVNIGTNTLTVNNTGSASPTTISGTLSGSGGLTKLNSGSLTISNDQTATFSGNTTFTGGTMIFGSDGALGTGNYSFGVNDNTIAMRSSGTASRTLGNAITLLGNGNTLYTFGSTTASVNGNLVFSNTGTIALASTTRKMVVNNRTQFNANFTGTGGLTMQTGVGTLVLAGANTYTGATTVSAGTLLVNGSLAAGSAVTVASGAALGGTGTVNGVTTVNGSINPGDGLGTLTVANDVTWNGSAGQDWKFELGVVTGSSDLLALSGAGNDFLKGTGSDFRFDFLNTGVVGTFKLVDWDSATTFNISDFTYTNLASGLNGSFAFNGSQLDFTVVAVPEPSTYALMGMGLGALALLRSRRNKRA